MSPALFAMAEDTLALQELLIDDESQGAADSALEVFMQEIAMNQSEKLDQLVKVVKMLESKAVAKRAIHDQYKTAAAEMRLQADYAQSAADRVKGRVKEYLTVTGQKKATTASGWDVSVVGNGGQLPLDIREDVPVPQEWMEVVTTLRVDKDRIRKHLESGEPLPFACLQPRGTRLAIK